MNDDETHWKERTMNNVGQILSLSHDTNKLVMRHHFGFGASGQHFQFLNTTDEYCNQVLTNLTDNFIIQLNLFDRSDVKYATMRQVML